MCAVFSHPVCGHSLQQPQETNAATQPSGALRDPDEGRCHCHGTLLSKLPGLLWAVTGNLSLSTPGPVGQRLARREARAVATLQGP